MRPIFSLLTPDSAEYLRKVMQASPIQLLDTFALYIGNGEFLGDDATGNPDEPDYEGVPTTFDVVRNPLTGNQTLALFIQPSGALLQRCEDLGNAQPYILLSSMIHGIPRNYRAFMNSCEESFMRDKVPLAFYAEFVVES